MSAMPSAVAKPTEAYDVVVVGAGFAGMYMLHRLRGQEMTARVFEQGSGVGGTWYQICNDVAAKGYEGFVMERVEPPRKMAASS